MKVMIFNTLYYPNQIGGAEKSVQLLAEGLLEKGLKPIIVTTGKQDYVNYVNGIKVYYVKTINLYWAYNSKEEKKYKKPLWHLIDSYNPFNKKVEKIIDNEKPNIIHTNNLAGFSVSIWKLVKNRDIKIVHTLRDYYLLCPKSKMFNEKLNKNCNKQCFSCKLYSIPKKLFSKYVDVVIGISDFVLKKHLEYGYFPNAKQKVIFNPVNIPNIEIKKNSVSKKKEIIFGYVGRIEPAKGIEFLLKYFPKEYKLFVYGKGEKKYLEKLKKEYKEKQIFFKGFESPDKIYSTIDILTVPSLWNEPFGRIVPEANAYKIPVLVTNRGGLPELVTNGKNGYIFDVENENDFYAKLELIIECFLKNKCKFDLEPFKEQSIIDKYMELYKEVLK